MLISSTWLKGSLLPKGILFKVHFIELNELLEDIRGCYFQNFFDSFIQPQFRMDNESAATMDPNAAAELLDLKEIETLKAKLLHVLETLDSILAQDSVNVNWFCIQPDVRNEISSQFNTLIAKFQSLVIELSNEKYSQAIIHPHVLRPDDPEYFMRVMLRTKLVPEVEDYQASVLGESDADILDLPALRTKLTELEVTESFK